MVQWSLKESMLILPVGKVTSFFCFWCEGLGEVVYEDAIGWENLTPTPPPPRKVNGRKENKEFWILFEGLFLVRLVRDS